LLENSQVPREKGPFQKGRASLIFSGGKLPVGFPGGSYPKDLTASRQLEVFDISKALMLRMYSYVVLVVSRSDAVWF